MKFDLYDDKLPKSGSKFGQIPTKTSKMPKTFRILPKLGIFSKSGQCVAGHLTPKYKMYDPLNREELVEKGRPEPLVLRSQPKRKIAT